MYLPLYFVGDGEEGGYLLYLFDNEMLSLASIANKQIRWIDIPRQYASGHKSVILDTQLKKHFLKRKRAITLLLTDGVQFH